jgi:hypothetical protein
VRIWDVSPGYLNRQSLLGEHRELHGLYVIVAEGRKGYSRHPETMRWVAALGGLAWRHADLVAEMALRGYADRTPLACGRPASWPAGFVDEPVEQFARLRQKYVGKLKGRIPLPRHVQDLWAQHKYSVMARDPETYRHIGRVVARVGARDRADAMRAHAIDLVIALRQPVPATRLVNALEHMWGHVNERATADERRTAHTGPAAMLSTIQGLALRQREPFLLASTALSELAAHVGEERAAPETRRSAG